MTRRAAVILRASSKRSAEERALRDPEDSVVIGRGSGATWKLEEPLLSRQHARISWRDQFLEATDLGSRNGTRVNGVPLRAPTRLVPGDRIEMGALTISIEQLSTEADVTVGRPAAGDGTRVTLLAPQLQRRWRRVGGGAIAFLALVTVGFAGRLTGEEPPRREEVASAPRPPPAPSAIKANPPPRHSDPAIPTGELRRQAFAAYAADRRRLAVRLFLKLRERQPDDPVLAVVLSRIAP